jgi:hypothetical protein
MPTKRPSSGLGGQSGGEARIAFCCTRPSAGYVDELERASRNASGQSFERSLAALYGGLIRHAPTFGRSSMSRTGF